MNNGIIAANKFFDIRYTKIIGTGAKWLGAQISFGYALGGYGIYIDLLYGRAPARRLPSLFVRMARHGSCHNRPKFQINA